MARQEYTSVRESLEFGLGHTSATSQDGYRFVQAEIPPRKFTEDNLLSLPLTERVNILRDRVYDSWPSNFFYKEHPGLFYEPTDTDKPIPKANPSAFKLAAILEDYQLRQLDIGNHKAKINAYKAQYRKVFDRHPSKGKLAEAQAELDQNREPFVQEQERLESINQDVVYLFIKDFFLQPDGIRELGIALQDLHDSGGYSSKQFDQIFDHAKRLLKAPGDPEVAEFLCYKNKNSNLYSYNDALPLRQNIESALRTNRHTPRVSQLSSELLTYYLRYPEMIYGVTGRATPKEDFPVTALVYDLLYSAAITGDRSMLFDTGTFIEKRINQTFRSKFIEETIWYRPRESNEYIDIVDFVLDNLGANKDTDPYAFISQNNDVFNRELLNWAKRSDNDFSVGPIADRNIGLSTALNLLSKANKTLSLKVAFGISNPEDPKLLGFREKYGEKNATLFFFTFQERFTDIISSIEPKPTLGGLAFKSMNPDEMIINQETDSIAKGTKEELEDKESFKQEISTWLDNPAAKQMSMLVSRAALAYWYTEDSQRPEYEMNNMDRENQQLKQEISLGAFDGQRWYVSTSGDRFSSMSNPELVRRFKSIIFYPADNESHHVVVEPEDDFNGKLTQIRFTIDKYGELLSPDGSPVTGYRWNEVPFEHLLLTHLKFILMGAGNDYQLYDGKTPTVERDKIPGAPRRAHIRRLEKEVTGEEALRRRNLLKSKGIIIEKGNVYRAHKVDLDKVRTLFKAKAWIGALTGYVDVTYVREEGLGNKPKELIYREVKR